MDAEGFASFVQEAEDTLVCLTEPLTVIDAASLHRLKGLQAFLQGDQPGATLAFQAVLYTQPGYVLPLDVAPVGHPLRDTFDEAARYKDPGLFPLDAPESGWLGIDGRRTQAAPSARPYLFQRFQADGAVVETRWVPAGQAPPPYPIRQNVPLEVPLPGPAPSPSPAPVTRADPKGPLRVAGVALTVLGAAAYSGAFVARNQYDTAVLSGDRQDIRSYHGLTNGLALGGSLGGAVGATCLIAGFW
jgi:hypothetical protein